MVDDDEVEAESVSESALSPIPSPSVSSVSFASNGNASSLSPTPSPSESMDSSASSGNWSISSPIPSPSASPGKVPPSSVTVPSGPTVIVNSIGLYNPPEIWTNKSPSISKNEVCPFSLRTMLNNVEFSWLTRTDRPPTGWPAGSVIVINTVSPATGFGGLKIIVRFSICGGSGLTSATLLPIPAVSTALSPSPIWSITKTV